VVGAGVSGLVTAYLLARKHEVVLYERNDYFGGHSHTVSLETDAGKVHLDTGFIVYNEPAYPRLSQLLSELGVETQPSDMSFSVSCHACDLAYSSRGLAGMLASPRGMIKPRNLRLGLDILRFYRDGPRSLDRPETAGLSLSEYLDRHHYSGEFRRHFIVPLAAAVWSMPPREVDGFPAQYMLRFLCNHGLLGVDKTRWRWRTVTGGSRAYVAALVRELDKAKVCCPVTSVTRRPDGVDVEVGGTTSAFDTVVMACHADEALSALRDADAEERAALEGFAYTRNRAVLHKDASLLPAARGARASWNYVTRDCHRGEALALTYHLNRLQAIAGPVEYCVSVNPSAQIDETKIIEEMTYTHPRYSFGTLEAQARVHGIQGRRHIYFAGAYLGYGFHEDGVESAYRVASMLETVT
jgi:predicted NAD/FAD-binding protein